MVSFFARHEQNKSGTTENGEPSNGAIAWLLWGGDPGKEWAERMYKEFQETGDAIEVQSLVFSKAAFSRRQMEDWVREDGISGVISETEGSYRVEACVPSSLEKLRTVSLAPGLKAVVGQRK
jgi:hypothetical protein